MKLGLTNYSTCFSFCPLKGHSRSSVGLGEPAALSSMCTRVCFSSGTGVSNEDGLSLQHEFQGHRPHACGMFSAIRDPVDLRILLPPHLLPLLPRSSIPIIPVFSLSLKSHFCDMGLHLFISRLQMCFPRRHVPNTFSLTAPSSLTCSLPPPNILYCYSLPSYHHLTYSITSSAI